MQFDKVKAQDMPSTMVRLTVKWLVTYSDGIMNVNVITSRTNARSIGFVLDNHKKNVLHQGVDVWTFDHSVG